MPFSGDWKPDDERFWKEQGHQATSTLPSLNLMLLLLGASIWMIWAVLSVLMVNLGYPFKIDEFFGLIATAGLSAMCMRMASGFFLHHCGTRAAILLNSYLLLIPLFLLWCALDDLHTRLLVFHLVAISTGLGAGLLSQVVGNSYYLFPKKMRPMVQEVPLALANIGLVLVLVAVPLLVQWPALQHVSGVAHRLLYASSDISGRVDAGQPVWLTAVVWLPILLLLPVLWKAHRMPAVSVLHLKQQGPFAWSGLVRSLLLLALVMAFCVALILPELYWFEYMPAARELTIFLAVALVLLGMYWLGGRQSQIARRQLQVFSNREVHVMALMYLMGMGSLLGFALSFPLLIKAIFGLVLTADNSIEVNPVAPAVLIYGWLPVVLGLLARALGSWWAYRVKPEKVNQLALTLLLTSALGMAFYAAQAMNDAHPERWFFYFFSWSLVFFVAAGVSAGAVMTLSFKVIPGVQMEYAINWILTLATAGAFYIPRMFADHWQSSGPAAVIIGFALFYLVGMVINWYFYLRQKLPVHGG